MNRMTIAPEAFLPFIEEALEGMVAIAEALGDERVNLGPDLPDTNSPFAILTHLHSFWRLIRYTIFSGDSESRKRAPPP